MRKEKKILRLQFNESRESNDIKRKRCKNCVLHTYECTGPRRSRDAFLSPMNEFGGGNTLELYGQGNQCSDLVEEMQYLEPSQDRVVLVIRTER